MLYSFGTRAPFRFKRHVAPQARPMVYFSAAPRLSAHDPPVAGQ